MSNPKVSIIIPVYNVTSFLRQCITSVLNQTYKNIEVIAVDDKSTDDSLDILKSYDDERLIIVEQSTNQGQAAARNKGLDIATGEYIQFVDSDDFIELDMVEKIVNVLKKTSVDFIRFNAKSYNDREDKTFNEDKYIFNHYLRENKIYRNNDLKFIYYSFTGGPCLYTFSRELIQRKTIRFFEGIIHEDELFNTMIYLEVKSAAFIDQEFYIRRYREGSTMTDKSEKQLNKSFNSYLEVINQYEKLLLNSNLKNSQQKFLKYRVNSVFYNLRHYDIYKEKYRANQEIEILKVYHRDLYKQKVRLDKAILQFQNKF